MILAKGVGPGRAQDEVMAICSRLGGDGGLNRVRNEEFDRQMTAFI